jgi:septum site-determining protein MinD
LDTLEKPAAKALEQAPKKARVLSVISAKGGVGKTTIAANLGVLLAKEHKLKTLIIDADLQLPTLGFHLDLIDPDITLHDVLKGKFAMNQAIHPYEYGVHIIPGSVSEENVTEKDFRNEISQLSTQYDVIIIDTMPCNDEGLKNILTSSSEIIIVTSPDLPSMTASLKAVKLSRNLAIPVRGVVINKVRRKSYELSSSDVGSALGAQVLASIPEDAKVYEALFEKKPVVLYAPRSPASGELKKLADVIAKD